MSVTARSGQPRQRKAGSRSKLRSHAAAASQGWQVCDCHLRSMWREVTCYWLWMMSTGSSSRQVQGRWLALWRAERQARCGPHRERCFLSLVQITFSSSYLKLSCTYIIKMFPSIPCSIFEGEWLCWSAFERN